MTTVDEALARVQAAIRAAKKGPADESVEERRKRTSEAVQAQVKLIDTSRTIVRRLVGLEDGNGSTAHKSELTEEQLKRPVRWKSLFHVMDSLLHAVDKPLRTFHERLKAMEAEVAALKARPTMKYQGVWEAQKTYSVGDFVTHAGALWHCEDANISVRPGSESAVWKLAVKRGRADR